MTNTNFTKTAEGTVQERNDRYAKVFQPLTFKLSFFDYCIQHIECSSFIYEGEGGK